MRTAIKDYRLPCATCIHFNHANLAANTCRAFPLGIPPDIFTGRNDHRKPYEGDHGIRYSPVEERAVGPSRS